MSQNSEYISENKILLQRYFFFNFLVSASLTEFLALSKSIGLYQDMHESIYTTLSHLVCQLSSKPLNDSLDEAVINDVIEQSAKVDRIRLHHIDTVQGSIRANSVAVKVKDLQESGESTTVALIRMLTTNIVMVVND